jgi:hypothetical protein
MQTRIPPFPEKIIGRIPPDAKKNRPGVPCVWVLRGRQPPGWEPMFSGVPPGACVPPRTTQWPAGGHAAAAGALELVPAAYPPVTPPQGSLTVSPA